MSALGHSIAPASRRHDSAPPLSCRRLLGISHAQGERQYITQRQPALATSTCPACCDAHSESELGHKLPHDLTRGAAVIPQKRPRRSAAGALAVATGCEPRTDRSLRGNAARGFCGISALPRTNQTFPKDRSRFWAFSKWCPRLRYVD
jgi:hypothetical protein